MTYSVKEVFYTLQGEGLRAGRPAVFCRFAGCNLWSGLEADRANATCRFCDTEFVGTDGTLGGKFTRADQLAARIASLWPSAQDYRYVVLTGGEPLLQVDEALIAALHAQAFEIAVETNGTLAAPPGLDWVCVSPKAGAAWAQRRGNELKLVYPQTGLLPEAIDRCDDLAFEHYLLQPMDGPDRSRNVEQAIEHCKRHPRWKLSLQTHKLTGIR